MMMNLGMDSWTKLLFELIQGRRWCWASTADSSSSVTDGSTFRSSPDFTSWTSRSRNRCRHRFWVTSEHFSGTNPNCCSPTCSRRPQETAVSLDLWFYLLIRHPTLSLILRSVVKLRLGFLNWVIQTKRGYSLPS